MEIRHLTIPGDGVSLRVTVAGEGPPVVLLHGFPEGARSWDRQLEPLAAAGFSVWAPDLRGYGGSDKPAGRAAYRIEHLLRDVAGIIKASGHERAHLVGHDWGGVMAWAFAAEYPELLDRLVILNAPHLAIYRKKLLTTTQAFRSWYVAWFQLPCLPERLISARDFAALRRMFRGTGAFSAEQIESYVSSLRQPHALTAALNYYRANFRSPAFHATSSRRVQAPTCVLWGERDPFLVRDLLDGLSDYVPQVEIHRYPDASHWIQNEKPDEVNRTIIRFLK